MEPIHLPSDADIHAAYSQGEEAVVTLFHTLNQVVLQLVDRVQMLEDHLNKDSHNSNKPPSSDGLKEPRKRHTHSLRQASGKKPGAQEGHPGHRLEMAGQPDHVEPQGVESCAHCQASLKEVPVTRVEKRQMVELPPLRLITVPPLSVVYNSIIEGNDKIVGFDSMIRRKSPLYEGFTGNPCDSRFMF